MRFKCLAILALTVSCSAHAGPYGDDLAKCLVDSTTKEDRIALVRWMFTAAAANPAVASIAKVTPKVMDKAKTALKYEGPATIQLSFQVLGQVAAGEMFATPEVREAMSGLEKYVDKKKIEEL